MFGKKKQLPTIDKDQLELIENAQKRIRQKKRVYVHFVIFLIGAVVLILVNTVLGIGENFTIAGINWFVYAILAWLAFFIYHFITVFITLKFMGKDWEKQQLDKLVSQQQQRIDKLKGELLKEERKIAQSQAYNETHPAKPTTEKKKTTELTIIVAAGEDNAIGKDNDLIWHLSDDLKRFKKLTSGHHIIMGRKTFESVGHPLPKRLNIVVTRQDNYKAKGAEVFKSIPEAIAYAKTRVADFDNEIFIIGGGEIYKQSLKDVNTVYLTRIHKTIEGDAYYPELTDSEFKLTNQKDRSEPVPFSFLTYKKIDNSK